MGMHAHMFFEQHVCWLCGKERIPELYGKVMIAIMCLFQAHSVHTSEQARQNTTASRHQLTLVQA